MPQQPQIGIQQRHPVLCGAAGQRQVEQVGQVGAGGLGGGVLEAIGQLKNGMGFEYGIAVVIMAIILDRIFQGIGRSLRTEDKILKQKGGTGK